MNKVGVMNYLLYYGGTVYKEIYQRGVNSIEVTWIRFENGAPNHGKYIAVLNDKVVGFGHTKGEIEDRLGLLDRRRPF